MTTVHENRKGRKVASGKSDFRAILRRFGQGSGESSSFNPLSQSSMFLKSGLHSQSLCLRLSWELGTFEISDQCGDARLGRTETSRG